MSLDAKGAALALHRFGLGPRPGSIAAIASDPRGALLAEIDRPNAGRISDADLLNVGEASRATFDYRQERKAARLVDPAVNAQPPKEGMEPAATRPDAKPGA